MDESPYGYDMRKSVYRFRLNEFREETKTYDASPSRVVQTFYVAFGSINKWYAQYFIDTIHIDREEFDTFSTRAYRDRPSCRV